MDHLTTRIFITHVAKNRTCAFGRSMLEDGRIVEVFVPSKVARISKVREGYEYRTKLTDNHEDHQDAATHMAWWVSPKTVGEEAAILRRDDAETPYMEEIVNAVQSALETDCSFMTLDDVCDDVLLLVDRSSENGIQNDVSHALHIAFRRGDAARAIVTTGSPVTEHTTLWASNPINFVE